jgi:hypothetical protein
MRFDPDIPLVLSKLRKPNWTSRRSLTRKSPSASCLNLRVTEVKWQNVQLRAGFAAAPVVRGYLLDAGCLVTLGQIGAILASDVQM